MAEGKLLPLISIFVGIFANFGAAHHFSIPREPFWIAGGKFFKVFGSYEGYFVLLDE